jgi:hypothetical protein
VMVGKNVESVDHKLLASRLLFLLSAAVLTFALGWLVYHYVLFQGTIRALTEF